MDTKVVEARKNVTIFQRINSVSSFTYNLGGVSFTPDEVVVKGLLYNPDVAELVITTLYCDFLSESLGGFYDNLFINPDLHFIVNKPVNQTWKFTIVDVTGLPQGARVGDLLISLEFVKYRAVKEGKVY